VDNDTGCEHTDASACTPPHLSPYVGVPAMEGGCYAGTIFKLGLKTGVGIGETKTCKMLLWCDGRKPNEVAKKRMVSGNPGS